MLTKDQINLCKEQGNGALVSLVNACSDNKSLLFILKHLGRLPKDFDENWVTSLLSNKSNEIRLWSVKTLGKHKQEKNIPILQKVASEDESTAVRCEAVSSIGRLKSRTALPALLKFLHDDDPKIVLQAVRGALCFKHDNDAKKALRSLSNHPNETVKHLIQKEVFPSQRNNPAKPDHVSSPNLLKNVIVLGDTREALSAIPEESFHLTFTSPPYYNARDYSIYRSYQEYLDFLKQVFLLTYHKTKEGGFLIVNTSPIIIPRISRQHSSKRYPIPFDLHGILTAMDWEFIDDIVWEKPETSVKNRNAGFLQHRKPLGYKPNPVTEYLMVYRKKTDKLLDWNIRQYDRQTIASSKVKDGYETSNIWKIDPKHDKVHSAVFPASLCSRVIQYYSFKGDLVFDPFAGSGTFGRVAKRLERFFFLTEENKKYFEYMKTFLSESNMLREEKKPASFISLDEFKNRMKE